MWQAYGTRLDFRHANGPGSRQSKSGARHATLQKLRTYCAAPFGMFDPDALRDGLPLFKCYRTPIAIAGDGAKHVGRASALASACADKGKAPVPIAVRLQIIAPGAFHPERNRYGSLLRAAQHGVLVFEESGGGGKGWLGFILPPDSVMPGKIK